MTHRLPVFIFFLVCLFAMLSRAEAGFQVCNQTNNPVGVAIGHHNLTSWSSLGWWNLRPQQCQDILVGELISRYYYLYAADYNQAGEWSGDIPMCIEYQPFEIEGVGDCATRGHEQVLFYEIDTGEEKDWTEDLTIAGRVITGSRGLP